MVSAPTPKPSINPKAIATSVIFVVGLIFSFAQEYFAYMRLQHGLWKADNFLIKCSIQSLSREGCLSCRTCSGRGRLSEIRRGWKFGLTPLPRLRSKAHTVIQEILLYSWALFAFKLGHATFPTWINCLNYNIVLTPCYHETCISYLCRLKIPQMCTWVIFEDIEIWKWSPLIAYMWGLQYLKGRKCNVRYNGELHVIQCCI